MLPIFVNRELELKLVERRRNDLRGHSALKVEKHIVFGDALGSSTQNIFRNVLDPTLLNRRDRLGNRRLSLVGCIGVVSRRIQSHSARGVRAVLKIQWHDWLGSEVCMGKFRRRGIHQTRILCRGRGQYGANTSSLASNGGGFYQILCASNRNGSSSNRFPCAQLRLGQRMAREVSPIGEMISHGDGFLDRLEEKGTGLGFF